MLWELVMDDAVISYAQNKEDILLDAFFPDVDKGFYVDVGASHPIISSVTKLFYEKGWRGINIEPSSKYYKLLLKDRPEDINLNYGVADKPGTLTFREYKGYGLSTFSSDMKREYEEIKTSSQTAIFKDREVKVKTLKEIFDMYKVQHISFLKIDIEGFEYEALVGNDWNKYRPEVICIESNHIVKDWRPLLKVNGYTKHFFDGLNDYYVSKESKQRAKFFSYPNAVLLGKPIIQFEWFQKISQLKKMNYQIERTLQASVEANENLLNQIVVLENTIASSNRLRTLIKKLLRAIDNVIIIQLSKLTLRKIHYPKIEGTISNSKDAEYILNKLHEADNRSFSGDRDILTILRTIVGKILLKLYFLIRRLVRVLLRIIARIFRAAKKRGTEG